MELLAVIAIIGIIAGIVLISGSGFFNNTEDLSYSKYVDTVENALCSYAEIHNLRDSCDDKNNCVLTTVNIENLIEENLISNDLKNPKDEANSLKGKLTINWNDGEKSCTYIESNE